MIALLFLLFAPVRAEITPAAPTVGDRITITFHLGVGERLFVTPSPDFEVISEGRDSVVLRTFQPHPFLVKGKVAGPAGVYDFEPVEVKTASVLKPKENLAPSPLKPPRREPWPMLPFIVGGVLLILLLVAVVLLIRRWRGKRSGAVVPDVPADDELRAALAALAATNAPRWAELADATRRYLGRVAPQLGPELTTSQLLRSIAMTTPVQSGMSASWRALLTAILRNGDLEKFSPFGPPAGDFAALLGRAAAELTRPFESRSEESAA